MLTPRLVISGLSGGSGKTMVSLGLSRAFSQAGYQVKTFKKGPDYIDAAWLALAARSSQGNLDPFFSPPAQLQSLFIHGTKGFDLALIEGNRGLFDGLDLSGSCSTSELARILKAPVLLVVDCTKMTRTTAALVAGCKHFEKDLSIGGVILNRTGNERHRSIVRRAVEELVGVPVLGALPRKTSAIIEERHMGLTGTAGDTDARLGTLADFLRDHVDLDRIMSLARTTVPLEAPPAPESLPRPPVQDHGHKPRIGLVRDQAFWFYYRENLDALVQAGAELVELSLLDDKDWPRLDGLYLGGGLPELYAQALSANRTKRALVSDLAEAGLPVYAECGGFMYLSRELILDGKAYPMAGVFPCSVEFRSRPQGLGYVEASVAGESPFFPNGQVFRGHEFHFSRVCRADMGPEDCLFRLSRGKGMFQDKAGAQRDGLLYRNTFASYLHIYAPALPGWAPAFVDRCRAPVNAPDFFFSPLHKPV